MNTLKNTFFILMLWLVSGDTVTTLNAMPGVAHQENFCEKAYNECCECCGKGCNTCCYCCEKFWQGAATVLCCPYDYCAARCCSEEKALRIIFCPCDYCTARCCNENRQNGPQQQEMDDIQHETKAIARTMPKKDPEQVIIDNLKSMLEAKDPDVDIKDRLEQAYIAASHNDYRNVLDWITVHYGEQIDIQKLNTANRAQKKLNLRGEHEEFSF